MAPPHEIKNVNLQDTDIKIIKIYNVRISLAKPSVSHHFNLIYLSIPARDNREGHNTNLVPLFFIHAIPRIIYIKPPRELDGRIIALAGSCITEESPKLTRAALFSVLNSVEELVQRYIEKKTSFKIVARSTALD